MRFSIYCWISLMAITLVGCGVKDPTCKGDTSLCPGNFWQPKEEMLKCPCEYPWNQEIDCTLAPIQKEDVQISDLIDVALLMNPTTHFTWAEARAAAYGVGIAESALYPSVELDNQLTIEDTEYDDGPPMTTANDKKQTPAKARRALRHFHAQVRPHHLMRKQTGKSNNNNSALVVGDTAQGIGPSKTLIHDLSVSYLLFDFGGREASIEAAKQALYNSNWTHNRQIQQVIISVLRSYYDYVSTVYLLEARYSDLENAQKNHEAAKVQFETGTRSKLDLLQAETNLINIELSIVRLKGEQEVYHGTLANALGLPANTPFHVPKISHLQEADRITEKVDQLIEEGIKYRPDLAAAYAIHAQRKAEVIVARSQGLPTLGALVEMQEFNDLRNSNFNTHSLSGTLMLSTPLFSGYLYENQERQARELVRAACANIRTLQNNIALDVLTSYFTFKTAVKSLSYSEEFLKYSQEAYDAALIGYQMGTNSILDLLSAQRALSDARAQRIQARTQWAVALSNISFAMGTTGTEEEIKP